MTRARAAAALVAASLAGCGGSASPDATSTQASVQRSRAVRFAACMRKAGVAAFPDPKPSGEFTLDGAVNGTSIDPDGEAFAQALAACRGLRPSGFTGRKRTSKQQAAALAFARCMRERGIADFPDPEPGAPLIDTTRIPSAAGRGALEIPGFTEATDACGAVLGDRLGLKDK